MAVWLIHATPNHVYHGLVGNEILSWTSVAAERSRLSDAIDDLRLYWADAENFEASVQKHPDAMPGQLAAVAAILQPAEALAELPQRVRRLAIVAGNMLSEIPFAALPLHHEDDNTEPLIARYALSDLPCLSALAPLRVRAVGTRGDRGLNVRPPAVGLSASKGKKKGRKWTYLDDTEATIEAMEERLISQEYPLIQVDSHGKYDSEQAENWWLEFRAKKSDDGRLTAERFQA